MLIAAWDLVWFYGILTIVGYLILNPLKYSYTSSNSILNKYSIFLYTQLNIKTVLFKTIPFNINTDFQYKKTHPFQTTQFSISAQFRFFLPIYRSLSGATIPGQSRPGSDDNRRVLRFPQSTSFTGISPSDFLVS